MFQGVAVVWLGRFSVEVECLVSEAVNVLGEVRTDRGDSIFGDGLAALLQSLDECCERAQIMKDEAVCDQMVVLDGLSLLATAVFSDYAVTAEEGPLEKTI